MKSTTAGSRGKSSKCSVRLNARLNKRQKGLRLLDLARSAGIVTYKELGTLDHCATQTVWRKVVQYGIHSKMVAVFKINASKTEPARTLTVEPKPKIAPTVESTVASNQSKIQKGQRLLDLARSNGVSTYKELAVLDHCATQTVWRKVLQYKIRSRMIAIFGANAIKAEPVQTLIVEPKQIKLAVENDSKDVNPFHMELTTTDFWKFYVKNEVAVNKIIESCLSQYRATNNEEDLKDIKQDILMRLERCNALGNFDPKRSQIHTWITGLVRNYARTLIKNYGKKPYWDPWPTLRLNESKSFHREQTVYKSINGVNSKKDENDFPKDLVDSEESTFDSSLRAEELTRQLKARLTPELVRIFELNEAGNDATAISLILEMSLHLVRIKMCKIKATAKKVLKTEEQCLV